MIAKNLPDLDAKELKAFVKQKGESTEMEGGFPLFRS